MQLIYLYRRILLLINILYFHNYVKLILKLSLKSFKAVDNDVIFQNGVIYNEIIEGLKL